jgi:hypothetical protein
MQKHLQNKIDFFGLIYKFMFCYLSIAKKYHIINKPR